jgi:hypothetical protein
MKWLFPVILASGVAFVAGMAAANDTTNPKTTAPQVQMAQGKDHLPAYCARAGKQCRSRCPSGGNRGACLDKCEEAAWDCLRG